MSKVLITQAVKHISVCVLLLLTLVFAVLKSTTAVAQEVGVPDYSGKDPNKLPILAPCTRFEESYETLGYTNTPIDEWPAKYHKATEDVVEEMLRPPKVTCTADSYSSLIEAGPKLTALAKKLPPWQGANATIARFDMARVLLENLRIYECAMMEYDRFLYYDTTSEEFEKEKERQEEANERSDDDPVISFFDFFFSDLLFGASKRYELIQRERIIARKTLNRTLTLLGTMDRFLPLQIELECMQRMSIDMRNIAALSAETSSCMPKTWNAKDVLRDYKEESE